MAQYVTVPAAIGVAHRPDGISERDAGALGVAGSAAFELAALSPIAGGTELISGATGGVGALAVQFAVARGSRVIATAKPGTETEFVSALTDADVLFVDYTQDVTAQVRAIAPGGVDAVLHLAGDLTELTALARDGGAVVSALATPEASEDRRLQTTVIWANPKSPCPSSPSRSLRAPCRCPSPRPTTWSRPPRRSPRSVPAPSARSLSPSAERPGVRRVPLAESHRLGACARGVLPPLRPGPVAGSLPASGEATLTWLARSMAL
jgi:hypothetical protein